MLRGRRAAKGRVGFVKEVGLKGIERQITCNEHIHLFLDNAFFLTLGIKHRLLRDLLEADNGRGL